MQIHQFPCSHVGLVTHLRTSDTVPQRGELNVALTIVSKVLRLPQDSGSTAPSGANASSMKVPVGFAGAAAGRREARRKRQCALEL